jgi:hypothetical protein
MNTGSNYTEKTLRFILVLTAALMALSIGGCGPSEKQLKDEAERKAKEAESAKIEKLQSKVRDGFNDPASTQFRNTKLLSGNNVLCGEVNSKNAYGGYVGFKQFAVNSAGEVVILEAIPAVEVITLSKKTKEERKEYVQKHAVQFAMLGQMAIGVQMSLELDQMEKFNMDNFSLWGDCFAEK